jgi:hypothetical protein
MLVETTLGAGNKNTVNRFEPLNSEMNIINTEATLDHTFWLLRAFV